MELMEGSPAAAPPPDGNPASSTETTAAAGVHGGGGGQEVATAPAASTSDSASGDGGAGGDLCSKLVDSQLVAVPLVAVPCIVAHSSTGFAGQFAMTHQAALATVTAQSQMQPQISYPQISDPCQQKSPSIVNPTPISQSIPIKLEVNAISPKLRQNSALYQKPRSPHSVVKATSSDGYNWRKYGQKQVKSSENFRSYFRCTHANCFAKKKVEHWQDGHVVEVIYQGQHNHEPPQRIKYPKECLSEYDGPVGEKKSLNNQRIELDASDYCTSRTENDSCNHVPEEMHCSSDCEGDPGADTEEDNNDEPVSKRRVNSTACSAPLFKTIRKPKVVVQASCDLGKVNDGYRWRKYGQKIVKGNPNPRSYYKCTNMGCPVRKHVEKALKDAQSVIITYEGQHNHDLPATNYGNEALTSAQATRTPKDALKTIVELTSDRHMQTSSSMLDKKSRTRREPVEDGESAIVNAMDLGEMALESAETLLSIGCKTSSKIDKANNPDVVSV